MQSGTSVPAARWVAAGQLQGEGLSSSVVKVAKLAAAADASAKKGIKRFFAGAGSQEEASERKGT